MSGRAAVWLLALAAISIVRAQFLVGVHYATEFFIAAAAVHALVTTKCREDAAKLVADCCATLSVTVLIGPSFPKELDLTPLLFVLASSCLYAGAELNLAYSAATRANWKTLRRTSSERGALAWCFVVTAVWLGTLLLENPHVSLFLNHIAAVRALNALNATLSACLAIAFMVI